MPGRWSRFVMAGLLVLSLPAGMASAQAVIPGQDSSEPIEIIADTLVVQQEKQIATFTGNVVAVQGDMTLKSDLLRVFYAQEEAPEGAAAPADSTCSHSGAPRVSVTRLTTAIVSGAAIRRLRSVSRRTEDGGSFSSDGRTSASIAPNACSWPAT